jgi:hypothetical protein
MALAFAVAPLTGGAIASFAGIETSFIVIGCVMMAVGASVLVLVREPSEAERRQDAAPVPSSATEGAP